jgi:Calcineurin-like phosphoesterase
MSVLALAAPLATGTWSLQFLSLFPFAAGLAELYTAVKSPELRPHPASYLTAILAIAAAVLLFLSPALVVAGVVVLLLGFLATDGALKLGEAVLDRSSRATRTVAALNGMSSLLLALLGWGLWRYVSVELAIGVAVAGYTTAAGWRLLVSPHSEPEEVGGRAAANVHPDPLLLLGEHEQFGETSAIRAANLTAVRRVEAYWLLVAGIVLFATHVGRMRSYDTWLGLISPFVATAGDVVMAVVVGALLVLPLRLCWRRLSRPLERRAWRLRFLGQDERMDALPRWLIRLWTDTRFAFAASLRDTRTSLLSAGELALRLGLPIAVLFVALNPIWGFTWYFNTESWASGFYQKMTALRVDTWRASMVDAVTSAYSGGRDDLFRVAPADIEGGDFSFIVIGDPGEGDPSQYVLVERYLALGRRADVKFLVISSDVIYPAGAMVDYETNFYLPFKGFTKPIYAIPGNHDWFDALEGFNANFLEPEAARLALAARVRADLDLTSTDNSRIERLIKRAHQLRESYAIQNAKQRASFFELQTNDFALLAIDTGIRRTVDDRQRAWIADALQRSSGKVTMVIVGHPKFAAGEDTTQDDADFAALYAMLAQAGVRVIMAGDTHAFEYYLEASGADRTSIHHFVNGGGGAYLSIGSALAWPERIPTKAWAFYPSPEAIRSKLDAETPAWKQPFWQWIKRFGAWPISIETLSGMFDFNHAPFYQSFMEVRVERSRKRVVFALHGASGPVRWRDLHTSREGGPGGRPDDPVEFVVER